MISEAGPTMVGLDIVVVGAGLGGLGAAIALRLAGHNVDILEAAPAIGEVGAGIQVLPNSGKVLRSWGIFDMIDPENICSTDRCDILGWKGQLISSMDMKTAGEDYGSCFYDLHRADLHKALHSRATELGARIHLDCEVTDVKFDEKGNYALVSTKNSPKVWQADLVVGADGLHSRCRRIVLGKQDTPRHTGDMAYRLLLDANDLRSDPEIKPILENKAVTYWYGPGAHVGISTRLEKPKPFPLLNMVLLVPDDMPVDGPSTLAGQVDEVQNLFKDWDSRIVRLLSKCKSVLRWRLSIWDPINSWVHPTGSMVLLGDSVHATLPYLASGAGMAFEDGAVLGLCLKEMDKTTPLREKQRALALYESCRLQRTNAIVAKGNVQQDLNHLDDGPEQVARDARMRVFAVIDEELRQGKRIDWERWSVSLAQNIKPGDDPLVWREFGAGRWLLNYDACKDVRKHRQTGLQEKI